MSLKENMKLTKIKVVLISGKLIAGHINFYGFNRASEYINKVFNDDKLLKIIDGISGGAEYPFTMIPINKIDYFRFPKKDEIEMR